MPAYGSRAVYAEPKDDVKTMKKKAKAQGHFPEVNKSSEEFLHKKLQQIAKGKEVSALQQKRVALDDRLNYELETDRAMMDMRQNRMPGFRGLASKMMGATNAAAQVLQT